MTVAPLFRSAVSSRSPSRHAEPAPVRAIHVRVLAALLCVSLALPVQAVTALADQPLFSNSSVPGNLALPLSVEYPTAVSVAHTDATYSSANSYLGYFDLNKCYGYQPYAPETVTQKSHFFPAGAAVSRTCTGADDQKWSGNFLNWATMQTIDPFRSALTGGYRAVDTAATTILEKAWASGQGGASNFPNRTVTDTTVLAGATPFTGTTYQSRIQGLGERMTLGGIGATGSILGQYFNNKTLTGLPVLTRFDQVDFNWGTGAPGTGVNADNFSARWTVNSVVPTTGNYQFQTVSDDGVRLYVNGVLVIDNWTDHGPTTNTTANIALTQGADLSITLEYYESGGGAEIRLRWLTPGAGAFAVYRPTADSRNTGSAGVADPQLYIRVKVCDPSSGTGGVETNCKAYANGNYKPQGLMHQYADRIRYSVFGYLNDSNIRRDGGVLRAKQKFVGPTYPVYGSADVTNTENEWDASTGVYVVNPDAADAATTATVFGTAISNSGVLNYLNKFGSVNRNTYKTYDPVGELYYAALRYYKNLGNVAAWSDITGASAADKTTWADGFPVITAWTDPIQYTCQRNFILGIGDVNTHADKNVPGPSGTANEPTKPGAADGLMGDTSFSAAINAVTATNQIGIMEGWGTGAGTWENWGGCCTNNSALMAGLAYDANTRDIRPDLANPANSVGQTVQTFWLDVLEYQDYKANNQFYLAAKYGGFKVPTGFDPYSAAATLQTSWWNTTTDTVGMNAAEMQPRPDNYFTAARPDQVVDGLTKAFASIAAQLKAYTTSFATSLPQVSTAGNASFSALYDAQNWTGEVIASTLTFSAATGEPSAAENWRFGDKLETQAASAGWDTARVIASWNPVSGLGVAFRHASLDPTQQTSLDTSYRSGVDSSDYLNYLRGDRSQEQASTVVGSSKAYRTRTKLLGDIVGSKARPVGPPSMPFSNAANAGYSAFKTQWTTTTPRPTVVYVGANDGMLHAVNGALTGTNAGKEMFAYVPSKLIPGPNATPNTDGLAALGNPTFTHHNYVNATPNVHDFDFNKTAGASGAANWHSVLIGGLGKGGKGYYALDVTDPSNLDTEPKLAAKVLWEFSDADLGYTYGDPVVVKTKQHGWVAIFGSGYNNADGKGYFFIVNPRTGALIQKIGTTQGSVANDAGLAHMNAYVIDRTDGTADAAYAGDLLGNVWRLDLTPTSGGYVAPTRLAQLADSSNAAQPITSRVLIEVKPGSGERFVMVGTGRALDTTDISSIQAQSFYSILDGNGTRFNAAANLPAGVNFPIQRNELVANPDPLTGVTVPATKVGWYLEMGSAASSPAIGWRVLSDPTSYFGTVAFASTLPNGSACSPSGSSRVYAVDFGTGKTTLTNTVPAANGQPAVTSLIAYNTTLTGVITDLRYFSVGGVPRLVAGSDAGGLKNIEGTFGTTPGLRRLNWRELPLAD